jgi:hypothetical protein
MEGFQLENNVTIVIEFFVLFIVSFIEFSFKIIEFEDSLVCIDWKNHNGILNRLIWE